MRVRLRVLSLAAFVVACAFHPSESHAANEEPRPTRRPVSTFSVELNPLALAVKRFGGQLQFGALGPLTLVAGATYVTTSDTQVSPGRDLIRGHPAVQGVELELGGRWFVRLSERVYFYVGPSYLFDRYRQGDVFIHDPYAATPGLRPSEIVVRHGVALDAGLHAHLGRNVYLLAGLGVALRQKKLVESGNAGDHVPSIDIDGVQRQPAGPRFLLSVGVGF
jgi:hypothetical protein